MNACLFNTQSDNIAAYCRYHKCGMTVKQIRCKNCLGKNCWYLVKNEEHSWWKQRETMRKKRQDRKKRLMFE